MTEPPAPEPAPSLPEPPAFTLSDADIERIAAKVRATDDDVLRFASANSAAVIEELRKIGALTGDEEAAEPTAPTTPPVTPSEAPTEPLIQGAVGSFAKRLGFK